MSRDYSAEMDKLIGEITEGTGWIAAIEASRLYTRLADDDPDLLNGWLHATAVSVIRRAIMARVHQRRTEARRRAAPRAFAAAAAAGDETRLREFSLFRVTHVVDEQQTEKRASDMTGPEHLFVAEHSYRAAASKSLMLAAFHEAVADKIGARPTSEVMTEQQYVSLYRSITGKAA